MKTIIATEFLLSAIAIFFSNEVITVLVSNPTEHLAACISCIAFITIIFTHRAIRHVKDEMADRRAEADQSKWHRNRL